MSKKLTDMTLEELWQLFPIRLAPHDACWPKWFEDERDILTDILHDFIGLRITHVGSTAIPAIMAKPIIDILVEVADCISLREAAALLSAKGYICMSDSDRRISLNKGYTEQGYAERVFHIHLRLTGDHDEIYFRDYLTAHPEAAREYEHLKITLARQFEHDRDRYTQSKTEFILRYTAEAKA